MEVYSLVRWENHLFRLGPWPNHGELLVITRGYISSFPLCHGDTSPTKRGHGAGFGQQSPSPTRPLELATWPSFSVSSWRNGAFIWYFPWVSLGSPWIFSPGWWLTYPSETWWSSSVGVMTFRIYGIKHVPNHQPVTNKYTDKWSFFSSNTLTMKNRI